VNDFYDNATALMYALLVKLHVYRMLEKLNKYDYELIMHPEQVETIIDDDWNVMYTRLIEFFKRNHIGFGMYKADPETRNLLNSMRAWYAALPPRFMLDNNGQNIEQAVWHAHRFKYNTKVIHMYEYNDGHSRSGPHFGEEFGFIECRFRYTDSHKKYEFDQGGILECDKFALPANEQAIDRYGTVYGYINGSGLQKKQVAILGQVLYGNKRTTPLLIDQDIDFGISEKTIKCFSDLRLDNNEMFTVTESDIVNTISTLVTTHKWYEELASAYRSLRYWLVQPGTETVEAHWWTGMERVLHLPRLGLRRAALPMLLEKGGVNISREALKINKLALSKSDAPYFESLFATTCWYWGEYLAIFNAKNIKHIIRKMEYNTEDALEETARADALYSAILGRAIPKPVFRHQSTYILGGIRSQFTRVMKIGQINISNMEEYGYIAVNNGVRSGTIVYPGCCALIIGQAGSLILGTPYASIFQINPTVVKETRTRDYRGYNYHDLWAYGVVQRWQGYDVVYKHPKSGGVHTMYAPNDVSIAMPPVNPTTVDRIESYTIQRNRPRQHIFGSEITDFMKYKMTFTWHRINCVPLEEPDYHSVGVQGEESSFMVASKFLSDMLDKEQYSAAVLMNYDIDTQDFYEGEPTVAVPVPDAQNSLRLAEQDLGPEPQPDEDPGPVV